MNVSVSRSDKEIDFTIKCGEQALFRHVLETHDMCT